MLYVDVSQLHRFLKAGKPVTGIQRLVLNSFAALHREFGDGVRALVFDFSRNAFVSCPVPKFFSDIQAGFDTSPSLKAFSSTTFGSSDQILFMEWFWNDFAAEASFERFRFNGAKIFRFIHDVIPAARPDLFRKSFVKKFVSNAKRAIEAADVVLTNSEYSKSDISRYFSANFSSGKPISVLRLPHEFIAMHEQAGQSPRHNLYSNSSSSCLGSADAEVIRALGKKRFALMVGTLEERKNTLQVIKAWQKLSRIHAHDMPDLVLVGNYSGHKILFTVTMCMNIAFTKSVIHLPRCNDNTLKWLYQNCLFSIYFSSYEGWGLPVGESLWFGKPVIAQPVSSMPEVGGSLADYVSAEQFDDMLTAIENLCFDAQHLKARQNQIKHAKLRKWQDFSTELVAVLSN